MRALAAAVLAGAIGVGSLVGVAPAAAQEAIGCSPDPGIDARLAAAPVAFTGVVAELRDGGREAYVDVIERWKGGDLAERVLVRGTIAEQAKVVTALDRRYRQGATYLFLPTRGTSPRFNEDQCSGTVVLTRELAAKAPPTRSTDLVDGGVRPPGADRSRYLPLGIASVAAAGLAVGLVLARRRGKARTAPRR